MTHRPCTLFGHHSEAAFQGLIQGDKMSAHDWQQQLACHAGKRRKLLISKEVDLRSLFARSSSCSRSFQTCSAETPFEIGKFLWGRETSLFHCLQCRREATFWLCFLPKAWEDHCSCCWDPLDKGKLKSCNDCFMGKAINVVDEPNADKT